MPDGSLYYWTHLSEFIITQVWQDGSYWRWAIVGFTMPERVTGRQPFIWKHGTGQTKNEACGYCELAIPEGSDEQLMMLLPEPTTPAEQHEWLQRTLTDEHAHGR